MADQVAFGDVGALVAYSSEKPQRRDIARSVQEKQFQAQQHVVDIECE